MAVKDFIISFFASSPLLTKNIKNLHRDYILFEPSVSNRQYQQFVSGAGGSVLGLWNKARGQSDTLGRVALLGFSEGCQGVSAVLDTPDASTIDVCIPVDGIHRMYIGCTSSTNKPLARVLDPVMLKNYIAFAKLAALNPPSQSPDTKLMVITHSSIGAASLPPCMASTTETAATIWKEVLDNPPAVIENELCGFDCPAAVHVSNLSNIAWPNADFPIGMSLPGGASITADGYTTIRPTAPESGNLPPAAYSWSGFADGWKIRRVANNFYEFGWVYDTPNHTKDPTGNRDHVFQAQMVLPAVALEMLVSRWNGTCTSTSGFGLGFTGGGGESGGGGASGDYAAACAMDGRGYYDQPATPLPNPYPSGIAIPSMPGDCPDPPPGQIIIGSPTDPCYMGPSPKSDASRILMALGITSIGGALGYFGTKRLLTWFQKQSKSRRSSW